MEFYSEGMALGLAHKYKASLEIAVSDKRSSLKSGHIYHKTFYSVINITAP